MPSAKRPAVVKRAVTLRLPVDLLALVEHEAIADGQARTTGRVYSPSATIERILRTYFGDRPKNAPSRQIELDELALTCAILMQVMDGEPVLIGTHDVGGMARDYFLKRLATVVGNLDGLTRGEHKYDYTIRVPASRLHDVTQEIARLQLDTEERFGVTVSALAAPIPG